LFYGGMVRSKNMLNTMMMSFLTLGLVTVHWTIFGYSLAFAPGNSFIGYNKWFALNGVGQTPNGDYAATIPHNVYCVYQMMFAIITPAIISGAIVERMKFSSYVIFTILWTTFVYDVVAHWVWSAWSVTNADGSVTTQYGWVRALGALDFAGGTVVHISSGISGFVAAIIVGKRHDKDENAKPANVVYVLLGGALLWFGWFGFNAGSALGSNGLAGQAFLNTNIATGTGFVTWTFLDAAYKREPSPIGAISGAVVGLVGITPAAGYVSTASSIAFGAIPVLLVYWVNVLKAKFLPGLFPGYDDSLDVSGAHGFGGIIGCLMVGFFASVDVNSGGANGVFFGGQGYLLSYQAAGVAAVCVYSAGVSAIILIVLKFTIGLSYEPSKIEEGLDLRVHGSIHSDVYVRLDTIQENKE